MHLRGTKVGAVTIGTAFLSSMGGFIFGYDTGQISDIVVMQDFLDRFGQGPADAKYFSNVREGLIVGLLSIGTLIGALAGRYLSDYLGRRRGIMWFCVVFSIGLIIQVASVSAWYQVAIGRLVSGLGVGALSAAVPVYQAETVPKQFRGTLIATYQLMITFGILLAYCFCIGTRNLDNSGSWRIPIALGWVFATILGVGIMFMPESPRWLVFNGRNDEAYAALARVRATGIEDPLVQADYNEIADAHEKELRSGKGSWLECFVGYEGGKKIAYRTMLGVVLQAVQQLTGANYFFYYGATVFQSVGISDSFATQIIFGAVNFVCTFGGLYIMEKFGRRWPLIIGGVWCSVWLLLYASIGVTQDTSTKGTGDFLIVASCMFILGYATTWAPGVWILIGETFEPRNRARQAALATASNWIWNFLLAFFTPFIVSDINYAYGYVFSGCCLFGAVFVYFFLYESGGISLESVNEMYYAEGLKPWQSGSWAPPGYATRDDAIHDAKAASMTQHLEGAENGRPMNRGSVDSDVTAHDPNSVVRGNKNGKVERLTEKEPRAL